MYIVVALCLGAACHRRAHIDTHIQDATLDGKALKDPVITWEQIQAGATLKFRMGPKPSRWGAAWQPAAIVAK